MYRILLVEDDQTLLEGIKYSLKLEDFTVMTAGNLAIAKKLFIENEYEAIILDIMLPDGSGYDFCREVRKTSDVPILFLTACDEEVNVVLGLDIGGDDYIVKPFKLKELISRINAVIRRNKKISKKTKNILIAGNLVLNALECRLEKDGAEILLTSMEYKLILMFMQNSFKVLSRNTILENLLRIDSDFVDDNTLSVYIKRLREKIDTDKIKYIKTIRGMGYKWDMEVRQR